MIDLRIRAHIVSSLKRGKSVVALTENLFREGFPEPPGSISDRNLINLLTQIDGRRPEETSDDILRFFCEVNNILHWKGTAPNQEPLHFFKLQNDPK